MTVEELKMRIGNCSKKIATKTRSLEKATRLMNQASTESDKNYYARDVREANKQIETSKKSIEKYQKQIENILEVERVYAKEIPSIMLTLKDELATEWTRFDIEKRKEVCAFYKEHSYREACNAYTDREMNLRHLNDQDIAEENEKTAKAFVLDFYNRVKHIVGEVTDWTQVITRRYCLNGIVLGTEGKAQVRTILAGGYNIQRLHVRTLVNEIR